MIDYILAIRNIYNNKKKMIELENGNRPIHPMETRNAIYYGLSKREHFAAMAMQGILANANIADIRKMERFKGYKVGQAIAIMSIEYSEELLKQLEK